jgi:LCP family protein required for cell wall assembly
LDNQPLDPQRQRKPFGIGRAVLLVCALVLVGAVALVAGFAVAQHRAPWLVFADIAVRPLAPPPQDLFGKDRLLVLVEGLDYDYDAKDQEFSTQSRSDVIMAVNLDFRDDNAYELSIPRDMDAVLPNGRETKINEAQAEGGVREAQAVIAKWLGIPRFDRYVILRINTTKDLINAIGGVNVNVMNSHALMKDGDANGPIDYDDTWGHLHIHFKPGLQHLNGDQAVSYARFRHDFCGDPCRIMRQQQVIHAFVDKLRNDKMNTLLHLHDLLGVFDRDVQTNLTQQEQLSLAVAFAGMPKDGVHTDKVPYVDDKIVADGGDVIIPDEAKKTELVQNMLIDPPVPTAAPDPGAIAAVSPSSVRVDVENGTGISGMAKRVASRLKQQGFAIGNVGNASSLIDVTELHEHTHITYAGLRVRQALGKAAGSARVIYDNQTPAPSSAPSDVTLIVGQDLVSALEQQASAQP